MKNYSACLKQHPEEPLWYQVCMRAVCRNNEKICNDCLICKENPIGTSRPGVPIITDSSGGIPIATSSGNISIVTSTAGSSTTTPTGTIIASSIYSAPVSGSMHIQPIFPITGSEFYTLSIPKPHPIPTSSEAAHLPIVPSRPFPSTFTSLLGITNRPTSSKAPYPALMPSSGVTSHSTVTDEGHVTIVTPRQLDVRTLISPLPDHQPHGPITTVLPVPSANQLAARQDGPAPTPKPCDASCMPKHDWCLKDPEENCMEEWDCHWHICHTYSIIVSISPHPSRIPIKPD